MDKVLPDWTISRVSAKGLPPLAVGYYKEVDGQTVFTAVAYCFKESQAEFIKDSFVAQATPTDWEKWEAEQKIE